MSAQSPTKVVEILAASSEYLAQKGVENPGLASKLLLSRLLNCKHLELNFKFNDELSDKQLEAMRRGIKRVASGEPVQYVIGETGFRDETLKVDERALIPRPETEVLVETVLNCEALWQQEHPLIIDVGTGSGCIAISIAQTRKQARVVAFDISAEALELARTNVASAGLDSRVTLVQADVSDALEPESVDAVVSNAPYIPSAAIETLETQVKDHEPHVALDGGVNGLDVIEGVVYDAAIVLRAGGFIFLEIGADQGKAVSALLSDAGFDQVSVKKDLAARDRVVSAVLPA
jgi:release factor glutamine methyltransferase